MSSTLTENLHASRRAMSSPPSSPTVRGLVAAVVGLSFASLLFWLLASVQPRGLEGDSAQVDQAWARLHTLEVAPPPEPPAIKPREKPQTLAPVSASTSTAQHITPRPFPSATPPRLATLTTPQDRARLDPLLLGLAPTPDGAGTGPALTLDPNGTALGTEGGENGRWLPGADPHAMAALLALGHSRWVSRPAANANRKPQWIKQLTPDYPPSARQHNQEGSVTLRLRISAAGAVLEVQVLDTTCTPMPGAEAAFSAAAAAAAEQSTLLPGTNADGQATEQWIKVSYLFQLR